MLICERILFRINKDVAHVGSASDSYFTVCELSRPKDSQSIMSGLVPAVMALVWGTCIHSKYLTSSHLRRSSLRSSSTILSISFSVYLFFTTFEVKESFSLSPNWLADPRQNSCKLKSFYQGTKWRLRLSLQPWVSRCASGTPHPMYSQQGRLTLGNLCIGP